MCVCVLLFFLALGSRGVQGGYKGGAVGVFGKWNLQPS